MDLDAVFGLICHQLPERSPLLHDHPFPLCWRCAGIHLGGFLSLLYLLATGGLRRRFPPRGVAVGVALLTLPMWIDGWANFLGLWSTPHLGRYATGVGMGVAMPFLAVPLASLGRAGEPAPSLRRPWHLAPLLLAATALAWPLADARGFAAWPVLEAAALAGILTLVLSAVSAGAATLSARLRPA